MECYKIENLSFRYPTSEKYALSDISLCVNCGEFLLVCGKSGCGKTTLLRLLKSALAPTGNLSGDIYFGKERLDKVSEDIQAQRIGFVMQNPENQIVTDKVWHELAFGLENMGFSNVKIRARVSEIAQFFGISDWFYKDTSELSGGQLQILNLASVMVMNPDVLILDEPTSRLDPIATSEFLNAVKKINHELGTTIILSEHNLEDAFAMADRVIVMDSGKIIYNGTAQSVSGGLIKSGHDMAMALPIPTRVAGTLKSGSLPITVGEGRVWLEDYFKGIPQTVFAPAKEKPTGDVAVELKDVHFRYEKNLPDVIKGLSMKIYRGEFYAIIGGNGIGKSTTLSIISGINKPYRGKRKATGVISLLPQNPQILFTEKTVREDLLVMNPQRDKLSELIEYFELSELLDRHPYDLSGGEAQRCALLKVLLRNPDILLFDEPTKGIDAQLKTNLADIIKGLTKMGKTIIMVSHDIEFCAKYADRCSMLFDGAITAETTPHELFSENSFYTTAAARMSRTVLPGAVLEEDIINACKGENNGK